MICPQTVFLIEFLEVNHFVYKCVKIGILSEILMQNLINFSKKKIVGFWVQKTWAAMAFQDSQNRPIQMGFEHMVQTRAQSF